MAAEIGERHLSLGVPQPSPRDPCSGGPASMAERFDAAGLLRGPVAADNAAMPTEPTKTDPPKRKRRWFRFEPRLAAGIA